MGSGEIFGDDPFAPSPQSKHPATSRQWRSRLRRRVRFPGLRLTPVRTIAFLLCICITLLLHSHLTRQKPSKAARHLAFPPPEHDPYRAPDSLDTFADYKHRATCNVSSLDLHSPFAPLCSERGELISAMAGGGRIGHDAPYMPRGCDMRWFTSEEVCEVLGRFDRVVLVGDSMLRHVIGGMNILVRKDLGYGAVTDWNFSEKESTQCFCNEQFDVKACSVQGIYKTADVLRQDPTSLKCSNTINVLMEEIVAFPVPLAELTQLRRAIGTSTPKKKAFILGHGLWSDLDMQQSLRWLDTVTSFITSSSTGEWHGLFLTPNAAGKKKPDEWVKTQGNKALMIYEERMGLEAIKRGLEHLGTWNMSIQATTYDGVHLDMKGNLVKTMMVMNWLNMLVV